MQAPGFWDDAEAAAKVSAEHAKANRRLQIFTELQSDVDDLDGLVEMAEEEPELEQEVQEHLASVEQRLAELEEQRLFSGSYDAGDALVSVNAGAGGTDAQDWAEMVLRMMMRWAERRGFKAELLEVSPGRKPASSRPPSRSQGKTPTVCSAPSGAFTDSCASRRSTPPIAARRASQASRWRRWWRTVARSRSTRTTCRWIPIAPRAPAASTSTRPTRPCASPIVPSGIVVQCQNERSQTSNRATAMAMLRSKLVEKQERERQEEIAREKGEAQDVNFGSQIRSYVLHPYSMAKDHRTDHEMGDVQRVLGRGFGWICACLSAKSAPSDAVSGDELTELVGRALAEDVGAGDVTTSATVARGCKRASADHAEGAGHDLRVGCGRGVLRAARSRRALRALDAEGGWREQGGPVLSIEGSARALLTGERTALNFLGRLSGIATLAARFVREVEGTGTVVLDTRKTTPGLRRLEKAAVAAGGATQPPSRAVRRDPDQGEPHRRGRRDRPGGGSRARVGTGACEHAGGRGARSRRDRSGARSRRATSAARQHERRGLRVAVAQVAGRAKLEASGNVTLENVRERALTGVDFISIGALTHSAPALDLSLMLISG